MIFKLLIVLTMIPQRFVTFNVFLCTSIQHSVR